MAYPESLTVSEPPAETRRMGLGRRLNLAPGRPRSGVAARVVMKSSVYSAGAPLAGAEATPSQRTLPTPA